MRQQQDKEFDSRLKEKMQGFSPTPPAASWENIDREINGSAVSRKKAWQGWLKIAASVCLLTAAGIWLVKYRGPFEREMLSITSEQDSVSERADSGVRIFNNSRSPDTAAEISGTRQAPETQPEPASMEEPAPPVSPPLSPAEDNRIQTIDPDVSRIASLGEPAGMTPDLADPTADAVPIGTISSRSLAADGKSLPDQEKKTLVPKEIRELSGVGEALNIVAAAIDRSEDKFLRIAKDEASGKWNGIRLDLGLVTISYNKPDKKTDSDKN